MTTAIARRSRVQILGPNGRPLPVAAERYFNRRRIRGKWDAAQTTADNRRHWAQADALSPDAAASSDVRQVIRNRARYECANNSYAKGIVLTLANYCIGRGPRLQILEGDNKANRRIEQLFMDWARAVNFAQKLRTMRCARACDGEAFGAQTYNPGVDHDVKLDIALIEADRVTETSLLATDPNNVDGIRFDAFGNPESYRVLKNHPGGNLTLDPGAYDTVKAESMVHTFRVDRPGQRRGVSEIVSALPLFAILRRYTLAVAAAAEAAANISGVIHTDGAAESDTFDEQRDDSAATPFEPIELDRNMWTTLPFGYRISQIKAEQPTTAYGEFKKEILNEIARCLNMPFNIAACNSAGYNYASGRLDHQTFFVSLTVDRDDIGINVCDPTLRRWFQEAALLGLVPQDFKRRRVAHRWMWDGFPHADPVKEAQALAIRLANYAETLANHYAGEGRDYDQEIDQRLSEVERTGAASGAGDVEEDEEGAKQRREEDGDE